MPPLLLTRKLFLDCLDGIVAHMMLEGRVSRSLRRLNGQVVSAADHQLRLQGIGLHFLRRLLAAVDGKDEEGFGFGLLVRHVDAFDLLFLGVIDGDEIKVPASFVKTSGTAILLGQFVDLLILLQPLQGIVVDLLAPLQEPLYLVELGQVRGVAYLGGQGGDLQGLVGRDGAVLEERLLGLAFALLERAEDDWKAIFCVFGVLEEGGLLHIIIFIRNISSNHSHQLLPHSPHQCQSSQPSTSYDKKSGQKQKKGVLFGTNSLRVSVGMAVFSLPKGRNHPAIHQLQPQYKTVSPLTATVPPTLLIVYNRHC